MKVVREDVAAVVRQIKIVSEPGKLRDDVTLADQGVDSLDYFNILLQLQEKFEIEIPDEDIDQLDSVPAIVNYLNQRIA